MADRVRSNSLRKKLRRAVAMLSLHFAPALEARFERDCHPVWKKEALVTGWFGLVMYNSFIYNDYLIDPSLLWRSAFVRLGLFTPIALVCLFVMKKSRQRAVLDTSKLTMITVAIAGLLFITLKGSATTTGVSQAGFLCLLFGALVFRMSVPFALLTNLVVFAEEALFLHRAQGLAPEQGLTYLSLVGACVVGSSLANHRLERSERKSYRLLVEAEGQQARLHQLNTMLEEISNRDGLTGLPNRRRFDEYSRTVSAQAWSEGLPVSIVMADIDHFKRFNDTFGHLAGDSVLAQVAAAVRSCVRGGNDLAARFGGEEFVLILPGADERQALQVAERAVATVRAEPLRMIGSDLPQTVTLSCGVACCSADDRISLTELIARADLALYQAKRSGRNQVCVNATETLLSVG